LAFLKAKWQTCYLLRHWPFGWKKRYFCNMDGAKGFERLSGNKKITSKLFHAFCRKLFCHIETRHFCVVVFVLYMYSILEKICLFHWTIIVSLNSRWIQNRIQLKYSFSKDCFVAKNRNEYKTVNYFLKYLQSVSGILTRITWFISTIF